MSAVQMILKRNMAVILGLIIEHQVPEAKVKLYPTKARKEFKMQGRSDARIEAFLKVYDIASLNYSNF